MLSIQNLRENYGKGELLEKDVPDHPMHLFDAWFRLALDLKVMEPNAMVLSTVDEENKPHSRVVLLKEYSDHRLVFFTNYLSQKARNMELNPHICLNFLWLEMEKQIRIEGVVAKISERESDDYFNSRPEGSKIGAWISAQSEPIENRKSLEDKLAAFSMNQKISRPPHWGGYEVIPTAVEFWQGRANRLHDRILYTHLAETWQRQRLQP